MLSSIDQKIHFVGVGGSGMSGIAEVLRSLGYCVSGSDTKQGQTIERLQDIGVSIDFEHKAHNVHGKDLLVVSSAIKTTNPEILEAEKLHIPIWHRTDMLAELMRLKERIIVAGTHGKTTTSSILAHIFYHLGLDPTAIIGGKVHSFNSNATIGQSKYFIAEADESDGSFLRLIPNIAIITNIDKDHLEYYKNLEGVLEAFIKFVAKVPKTGTVCLCLDDPNTQKLLPYIKGKVLTYGIHENADITARNIVTNGFQTKFTPMIFGKLYPTFTFNLPGRYNISNALASLAVAHILNLDIPALDQAFASFKGTLHRYTHLASIKKHILVDDYAHNPKKIETVLLGTRESFPNKKILVVFEPHKYSRLKEQGEEFAKSFNNADYVVLAPVYPAGELPIPGATIEVLADRMSKYNSKHLENHVKTSENFDEAIEHCIKYLSADTSEEGTVTLILGAGNIASLGHTLKERLMFET